MSEIVQRIRELRILPVIVLDDAEQAVPLARALIDGGLPVAEITFRTAAAAESIRRVTRELPEMLVGAGTVLSPAQVDEAVEAGATFVLAPGFNEEVVARAQERGVPVFPGVATPTEMETAMSRGVHVVKFFPAELLGGVRFLKAVSAAYQDIEFIPTGGVDLSNLPDYLAFERVVACGGSWMVSRERIRKGEWERIAEEVGMAVRVAHAAGGHGVR